MNTPHETENTKPQAASTPPSDERSSLIIDLGASLTVSINTGGGKTLGDRITDGGETAWTFGKKTWEKVLG